MGKIRIDAENIHDPQFALVHEVITRLVVKHEPGSVVWTF